MEALVKLLQAISGVCTQLLSINVFNTKETLPETSQIALPNIKTLGITQISPSFLAWCCETVDLSARTTGMAIKVGGCATTSIKCLDSLGVQCLRDLALEKLPNLQTLDCRVIESTPRACMGVLKLWDLPNIAYISKPLAEMLTEDIWEGVCMDMHIWNTICSQANRSMNASRDLWLIVHSLDELGGGSVCPGVESLTVEEKAKTGITYTAFFETAMGWVLSSGEGIKKIGAISVKSADPSLNTNAKQKLKKFGTFVSESEKWSPIFRQKTLYLNDMPVPIHETKIIEWIKNTLTELNSATNFFLSWCVRVFELVFGGIFLPAQEEA
ncbi:hypothetical protein NEDG_02255 [Nematocida displodere]|uniref:Uncharacterized protein n=1 Tax=Nematocida displodere TaxID=1805483 RepID=A0A177EH46_9MICR|nr:hypothetical protein NEDG_02255 [Nematocida displodere]